jgi:hypothetical protein
MGPQDGPAGAESASSAEPTDDATTDEPAAHEASAQQPSEAGPADDDWWFDKGRGGDGEPSSPSDAGRNGASRWRLWVAAGAIGVAAVVGISLVRAGSDGGGFPGGDGGGMPSAGQGGYGGPGGMGMPGAFGTVTSVDGDTFQVETMDGETVTVTVTDDTEYATLSDDGEREDAEQSDLEEGDDVMVMGEADDDGNVTATNVTFGDLEDGMGQRPDGGQGGPPSDSSDTGDRQGDSSTSDSDSNSDDNSDA